MKITEVMFFQNGNTATFDKEGKQVVKYQEAWFKLYIDFLKSKGTTDEELEQIKFLFPNNKTARYIAKYNNWSFEE